jgi:hypothetical protein
MFLPKGKRNMGKKTKKSGPDIEIHWVTSGEYTRGWVHTHGMDRYGLPELEIRDVPAVLVEAAGQLLLDVCEYMRRPDVKVRLGQTMGMTPGTRFRFVQGPSIPGNEDHYHPAARWLLSAIETPCADCGSTPAELD